MGPGFRRSNRAPWPHHLAVDATPIGAGSRRTGAAPALVQRRESVPERHAGPDTSAGIFPDRKVGHG